MVPAIVLLEFDSIAVGIRAGDAMVKRAPIATLYAGSVQPGKYLVLAGGEVGPVEEARMEGRRLGAGSLVDEIYLPDAHQQVVAALTGARVETVGPALGIIETTSVAATIGAADVGVKGARVDLLEIQMADGLGGKGYVLYGGEVSAVETAVGLGKASLNDPKLLVADIVIPQIHPEMAVNLRRHAMFVPGVRTYRTGEA